LDDKKEARADGGRFSIGSAVYIYLLTDNWLANWLTNWLTD